MEQEFTEDESSEDSVAELLDETLSGEDLDLDEQHPEASASSSSRKPRRSTRTTVLSRLNTSNEEEMMQPSPDVEVEEGFEEQEEWKPPEKPKRRRKAPITRRKRREKSDKQRPLKINTSFATGRPRGRPRRFNQQTSDVPHSEGQFDVYDEDKTPERDVEHDELENFVVEVEENNKQKIDNEEVMEGEVQEMDQEDTATKMKEKVSKVEPEVIDLDEDEASIHNEEEDSDIIFIPDEPSSPRPPTPEYSESLPFPPPPIPHPQSVVVYGLEESEEESSVSDSERTISDDDPNFDFNEENEQYDPEEIQRPLEETAQGSGAIVIDTIQGLHHHSITIEDDEEDENTQYSVEAELAQYAREDERNAQLDREMEEIGLKEDGMGMMPSSSSQAARYHEERIDRSNIQALRLDHDDEVANDGMDYECSNTPHAEQQQQQQQPIRHFIQIDDEIQEVYYGRDYMFDSPNNNDEIFDVSDDQQIYQSLNFPQDATTENEEIIEDDENDTTMYFDEGSQESSTAQNILYQESASPAASETSTIEITMSQLCIGGEVIEVPDLMLENESIFYHVLSKETFDSLSDEQQNHLRRFLPKTCETERDVKKSINAAFNYNPNYYFGSPMTRAFNRIRAGYFNVDRPSDLLQLQDNRRVWYDHFIRQYYMKLLKKMLLTRHAILEQAANLPEHAPIKINCAKFSNLKKRDNQELVKYRARKRAKMLINFAAEKTENDTASSDDSEFEEDDNPLHIPIKHEIDGESAHFDPEYADCDVDMYQPAKIKSIKELLKEFKTLKKKNPNCPSLDTSDITLEDVYERSGLSFQSERNFAFPQQCQAFANAGNKRKRRRKPASSKVNEILEEENMDSNQSPASVDPNCEILEHSFEGMSQA
uniref:Uncharacterized protein n=1 Tax=Panagrolaimus sp. ES5 TaxID=591445 RepID=A0AC34FW87_9BILA